MTTSVLAQQKIKVLGFTYHRINDTLYAGEREVSNLEYRHFLASIPVIERESYTIDSAGWLTVTDGENYMEPWARNYSWHPAFDTYPVVNISHRQAVKYCAWLTSQYNVKNKISGSIFRLPTVDEWMQLADTDPQTKLPHGIGNGQNKKGCYIFNANPEGQDLGDCSRYTAGQGRSYTFEKEYYKPTRLGLFHVIGNAAEMTTQDGIQKGGSWYDDPEESYTHDVQHHPTPDPRVGFRVVCVRKK